MAGNKYLDEQGLGHLWERIKFYTSSTYLSLSGGNVTGPVNFGDSVYISDLNAGNLIITGNASFINTINGSIQKANQLNQTSLASGESLGNFINTNNVLIYASGAQGNIYVDKPSTGNISTDGFGILSFQSGGYYSQILVSSNQNSGIYWRTGSSLSGGWKKLFDDSSVIPVANGGTNKSSWTQWGLVYASATDTLEQVAAGTVDAYDNKYQFLMSNGAAAPVWRTVLSLDTPDFLPQLDAGTNLNNLSTGTYIVKDLGVMKEIINNPKGANATSGARIVTMGGYSMTYNTRYWWQWEFPAATGPWFRYKGGTGGAVWQPWRSLLSSELDTAIGSSTQPVYIAQNGIITTCTDYSNATVNKANKANITTTENAIAYYSDNTGTFASKASAEGALYATSNNGTLTWGTLPVSLGGTGATSFTANSLIMSGISTTAALTTRAISTSITTDNSTNIPTEGAVKTYIDNSISTIQSTIQSNYVTIAGNAQQVTGRKTLSNLAGASFKPAEGSESCNISYNQSLGALVFSFTN